MNSILSSNTTNSISSEVMVKPNNQFSFDRNFLDSIKCINCNSIPQAALQVDCCEYLICSTCSTQNDVSKFCLKCKLINPKISPANKQIINILNTLKITCCFSGCTRQILFTEIEEHEKYCEYNPTGLRKCQGCSLFCKKDKLSIHSCIDELLASISNIKEEVEAIKSNDLNDKNKEVLFKIKHSLKIHEHALIKTTRISYGCDTCRESYRNSDSYYCVPCDFDCCVKCFDYSYLSNSNSKDNLYKGHQHALKCKYSTFTCSDCLLLNPIRSNYQCEQCKYIICFTCRFK